jgi:hypothetical protein
MAPADGAFDSPLEAVEAELALLEEGEHSLCVRGSDAGGNVSAGECISISTTCTVPEPPTGLKATLTRNDVRIRWSVSAGTERTLVYRRVDQQDPFEPIASTTETSWRDLDYGMEADFALIEYYVTAESACGASQPSAVVRVTPKGRR